MAVKYGRGGNAIFTPDCHGGLHSWYNENQDQDFCPPEYLVVEATGMNALLNRISIDPNICFGRPCIRGTRIWVSLLLDLLASGMTGAEILEEYPHLVQEDMLATIAYGVEMSREGFAPA